MKSFLIVVMAFFCGVLLLAGLRLPLLSFQGAPGGA
jgi:hypothetical protein